MLQHQHYFQQLIHALNHEIDNEIKLNESNTASKTISQRIEQGYSLYPINIIEKGFGIADSPYLIIQFKNRQNHRFSGGSNIAVFSNLSDKKNEKCKGIIQFIDDNKIKIFIHEKDHPEWLNAPKIGIDLLADEVSYKEMIKTLEHLKSLKLNELPKIYHFLYHELKNDYQSRKMISTSKLNDSQKLALNEAVNCNYCSIIHGPPGTGKTTTLTEIIKQLSQLESGPILVCAPSNAAVDYLVTKLKTKNLAVLRIGNISKMNEYVYSEVIEEKVKTHQDYKYLRKIKIKAQQLKKSALQYKRNYGTAQKQQRLELLHEAKMVSKEARSLEKHIIDNLIDKADVICTTLVGANHKHIRTKNFKICIIDEAGQAIEPACWIPIIKSQKLIIAGDPQQLPPVVKSSRARKLALDISLIEKLIDNTGLSNFLDKQYRMNQAIMEFSSEYFYDGFLRADKSVKNQTIDQWPLEFIDTAGCGFEEQQNEESLSIFNLGEIKILETHLQKLAVKQESIGIISPYQAQIKKLKNTIKSPNLSQLRIDTIDSFQGQEADIIYLSLVRSNNANEIGFLKDYRRMNVALTRARKKLIVIADSATIASDPFYKDFIDYAESINAYKSAWEFME